MAFFLPFIVVAIKVLSVSHLLLWLSFDFDCNISVYVMALPHGGTATHPKECLLHSIRKKTGRRQKKNTHKKSEAMAELLCRV